MISYQHIHKLLIITIILIWILASNSTIFAKNDTPFGLLLENSSMSNTISTTNFPVFAQVVSDSNNNNENNDSNQVESSDQDNRKIEQNSYTENNDEPNYNQEDSSGENQNLGLNPSPLDTDTSETGFLGSFLTNSESDTNNDQAQDNNQLESTDQNNRPFEKARYTDESGSKRDNVLIAPLNFNQLENLQKQTEDLRRIKRDAVLEKIEIRKQNVPNAKAQNSLSDSKLSSDYSDNMSALKKRSSAISDFVETKTINNPQLSDSLIPVQRDSSDSLNESRKVIDESIQSEYLDTTQDEITVKDMIDPAIQDEIKQFSRDTISSFSENDPRFMAYELQQELGHARPEQLVQEIEQDYHIDHPENIDLEERSHSEHVFAQEIEDFQNMLNNLPPEQREIERNNAPPHLRPFLNP